MIRQCVACKHFHPTAVPVPEGREPIKGWNQWSCDVGHKIGNPHGMTSCKDFVEEPSLKKKENP